MLLPGANSSDESSTCKISVDEARGYLLCFSLRVLG
jgi:hypothetical protein